MELGSEFCISSLDLPSKADLSLCKLMESENALWFDSGRSALRHALSSHKVQKVLLPEYICESVISLFRDCEVDFYNIAPNLQIDLDDVMQKIDSKTDCFYLMHYFGSVQPDWLLDEIRRLKDRFGFLIVEDTTHSLLSKRKTIGDFAYASVRKWVAIPDGGLCYGDVSDDGYRDLDVCMPSEKAYAMLLKAIYLQGQIDCNSEYRRIFAECEAGLDCQIASMRLSTMSSSLLEGYDIQEIRRRRSENFLFLSEGLASIGINPIVSIGPDECPLTFPIAVNSRDALKVYLASKRIYCANHWPFFGDNTGNRPFARKMGREELSLPIDQRYGLEEMDYLLSCINSFYSQGKRDDGACD